MSAADLSVAMLKSALEANGLASYGAKQEMLQRLLAGGSKKKPGRKSKTDVPKDVPKKAKSALIKPLPVDSEEAAFMLSERPRVAAAGITDYAEQTAELKRRWARVKKAKAKTSAPASAAPAPMVKLPTQLDAAQAASCGLTLVGTETTLIGVQYVYAPGSAASAAKTPAKVGGKHKAIPAVAAMPADDDDDDDDDDEEEEEEEDDMKWARDVSLMRLVKKAKKEHIAALCGDFGVPVWGTKQELATSLAEQLHYETDEEEAEEEE